MAKHRNCSSPNSPSVPSIVLSLAGYVKRWGHAALIQAVLRGLIAGSSTPNALSVRPAFDVLVAWRTRGLSASCQLGNYPASLPGATAATEPAQPSMAQRICCWLTRLIPWNTGLSYHSLVNDFIQAGWGHQRLCNKGAALCSKNSTPVCGSPKKKEKRVRKREISKCLWLWSSTPWARGEHTSCSSRLNSYFPSPITEETIISSSMNY